MEHTGRIGANDPKNHPAVAAAGEMILEGLWAHRRIGRSEERGYHAEKQKPQETRDTSSSRGPRRQFN
jgi:hypothetical protein